MRSALKVINGLVFLFALMLAMPAFGQSTISDGALERLSEIETRLDAIAGEIQDLSEAEEAVDDNSALGSRIFRLSSIRDELGTLEQRAMTIRTQSQEALDAVADLLPGKRETADASQSGETASNESPAADTSEPDRLASSELSGVTAPYRELQRRASIAAADARLLAIDASRLSDQITQERETAFVSSVAERGLSPVRPAVWVEGLQTVDDVWNHILRQASAWRQSQIDRGAPYPVLILSLVSFVLLGGLMLLYRAFYRWETKRNTQRRPSRQTVATLAMTSFLLRFSTAFAVVLAIAGVGYLFGIKLFDTPAGQSIAFVMIAVLCMRALVSSVMAPRTTAFRLIGVGDETARAISISFLILVVAFAADSVFTATGVLASPGSALTALRTFCFALLTGGLLVWLAIKLRAKTDTGKSTVRIVIRWLILLLAFTVVVTSLAGYHFLSGYIVERIVLVSIVLMIAILVREFVRAAALKMLSGVVEKRRYASAREQDEADDDTSLINSEFWIKSSVDTIVILALPPFLALAFGMPPAELWTEIKQILSGFDIAGQRISIGGILSALFTVFAIMLATRLIQRTLERQILPKSHISSGAANSLVTLLGYAGVIIAIISAVGVIGFDLSSLAIIAGALSVGIGFGLQSIVSNFVAGLILLFERPFKIGDWIVTPSGEGTVQKINVRATEVLTFDRRSIIVPNAELVSNSFGNWTHKSDVMRVAIAVGVKYGSDTRKVEKLLLEIAESVQYIHKYPQPYVVFKDFADSSVNFELRAFIVADHIVVAPSEVRHEIARVFEREGITIPFPQRDIHFDWPDAPEGLGRQRQGKEDDSGQSKPASDENEKRAASEREDS
ncbi:DUF3772 domain-containing protein [Henriciella sp. AS95]|uniref:DUF3772 domain-containing protein n=1 Tax=Henriciella sp. AS95 TaxID=3135782 RepID=UPI003182360F